MSKGCRPYDPAHQLLLPAALQQWLPKDQLAYFISDVVDKFAFSDVSKRLHALLVTNVFDSIPGLPCP